MRRGWVAPIIVGLVIAFATPAGAKTPPADGSAQSACQQVRLMQVNEQYGMAPSTSDYSTLIGLLQESGSKGAAKLYHQIFNAPTPAAQDSVRSTVAHWCSDTLKIRCSAFKCVDGVRVSKITNR